MKKMEASFKKHLEYYISFIGIQMIGFALILLTSYSRQLQINLIIITSFVYALWAIIHHYMHHDLTTKIVVEYILIGVLGVSVSLFIF